MLKATFIWHWNPNICFTACFAYDFQEWVSARQFSVTANIATTRTHTGVWIRVEQWAYWRPQLTVAEWCPSSSDGQRHILVLTGVTHAPLEHHWRLYADVVITAVNRRVLSHRWVVDPELNGLWRFDWHMTVCLITSRSTPLMAVDRHYPLPAGGRVAVMSRWRASFKEHITVSAAWHRFDQLAGLNCAFTWGELIMKTRTPPCCADPTWCSNRGISPSLSAGRVS